MDWLKRHGKIIHQYEGLGNLKKEKQDYPVSFRIAQFADGKIACVCEGAAALCNRTDAVLLTGQTSAKEHISATELAVAGGECNYDSSGSRGSIHLLCQRLDVHAPQTETRDPQEMRFTLTNLGFCGIEPYEEIYGTRHIGQLQLRWEIEGHTIIVRRLRDYGDNVSTLKATRGIDVTASASVSSFLSLDVQKITSLMDDLCLLLTLARGCGVNYLYWELISEGRFVERNHWSPPILPYTVYDLIPELPQQDLHGFIAQCFGPLRRKMQDWQLTKVLHMYNGAKVEDFLENRALKISVLMEYLCGRHLEMHSQVTLVSDDVFKQALGELKRQVAAAIDEAFPDLSRDLRKVMSEHTQGFNWYPFRRAVKDLCRSVELTTTSEEVDRFVQQRNELAHRGRFRTTEIDRAYTLEGERIFREMMTFVGRVILAILEYDGYYYDWTKPPGAVGDSEMRVKMPLKREPTKDSSSTSQ